MRSSGLGVFLLGIGVGLPIGLIGISFGQPGLTLAIGALVLCIFVPPRFAALSGALITFGGEWLAFYVNDIRQCAATQDFCGHADFSMLLIGGLPAVGLGALLAAFTFMSRRRG